MDVKYETISICGEIRAANLTEADRKLYEDDEVQRRSLCVGASP